MRSGWVEHFHGIDLLKTYKMLVRKPAGKRAYENIGVDGKIILKCV
jgi:hypothetical protein